MIDEVSGGYSQFLTDYGVEAAFAAQMGLDAHDGNLLEAWPEARKDAAVQMWRASGGTQFPFELHQRSAYDLGYVGNPGNSYDWAVWFRGSSASAAAWNGMRLSMLMDGVG